MKWFIPSWNGDLRVEQDKHDSSKTVLSVIKPTPREQVVVNAIGRKFVELGYLKQWDELVPQKGFLAKTKWEFHVDASIADAGRVASELMRPSAAVITAVQFSDGECIVRESAKEAAEIIRPTQEDAKTEAEPKKDDLAKPTAAATVRRPTCCCPQCIPGAVEPATEALLSFLTEEQHERWAAKREIVVEGNLSGHRYLLAHRHTDRAMRQGRICFDLDDERVIHFHDWTVPPEEEVLASLLILEHREHWLRNEATCLGGGTSVYKNPFGNYLDGVPDATLTRKIGAALLGMKPLPEFDVLPGYEWRDKEGGGRVLVPIGQA